MKEIKTISNNQEIDQEEVNEFEEELWNEQETSDDDLELLDEELEFEEETGQNEELKLDEIDKEMEEFWRFKEQSEENFTLTVEGCDLSNAESAKAKPSKRRLHSGKKGAANLVKSNNGNRFGLSNKAIEYLRNPEKIQILYLDNKIIVATILKDAIEYNLRKQGSRYFIYNTALVTEIADRFKLDFANGRTSITFYDVEFTIDTQGNSIVVINIK